MVNEKSNLVKKVYRWKKKNMIIYFILRKEGKCCVKLKIKNNRKNNSKKTEILDKQEIHLAK